MLLRSNKKPIGFYNPIWKEFKSKIKADNTKSNSKYFINKIKNKIMVYIAKNLQYTKLKSETKSYHIAISKQLFNIFKDQYNLNGRFKSSENLESDLNLVKTNYFIDQHTSELSTIQFRLQGSSKYSISDQNLISTTYFTELKLVIKFFRIK